MHLHTYRHLWGVPDSFAQAAAKFKQRGYSGLEIWMGKVDHPAQLRQILQEHDLGFIPLIATLPDAQHNHTPSAHLESFRRLLEDALAMQPVKINVHAGYDGWSAAEQDVFFNSALPMLQGLPCPVMFETHRGRPTFSPWNTLRLLEAFPQMRLTLDLSHWVVVCERLIDDLSPILAKAATACSHIHARVGYEQGPQVPNPQAPEYLPHLEAHERWWRMVWQTQQAQGHPVSTLTPEFGPPPYLQTQPHSQTPLANLEEVCEWMAQRQRTNFANWATN